MASLEGPFRSARVNRGPEALAVEPDGSRLWTANEEPLERDGPPVASGVAGKVRLVGLAIDDARAIGAEAIERRRELIYEVDPPHARVSLVGGPLYSGVVALAALGERRLLVLERSAAAGVPPLENRMYLVDTSTAAEARDVGGNLAAVAPVAKALLWKGALGVNLEGLCVGPRLPNGRLTLVAVADNGADDGVGRRPNPVACFFLTIP
jgi:3-phytase